VEALIKLVKPLILILTICAGISFNVELDTRDPKSIPFVGMETKYCFEIHASGWSLPGGGFLFLKYLTVKDSTWSANVSFRLYLDPFTGTENASMIEEAETRRIFVNTTGTRYVASVFFLLFDPSENATNRTPIWVFPEDLVQGNLVVIGAYDFEVQSTQTIETIGKKLTIWKLHFEEAGTIFRNYTALYESTTGLLINGEFGISEDSSRYRGTLRLEETNVVFEQSSFLRRHLRIIVPVLFGVGITGTAFIYTYRRRVEIEGGLDAD